MSRHQPATISYPNHITSATGKTQEQQQECQGNIAVSVKTSGYREKNHQGA